MIDKMKYIKKQVEVEAIKYIKSEPDFIKFKHPMGETSFIFSEKPNWLIRAIKDKTIHKSPFDELLIHTLEGEERISKGDYIIKGVNGELYPCKPDIFLKTYIPADESITKISDLISSFNNVDVETYYMIDINNNARKVFAGNIIKREGKIVAENLDSKDFESEVSEYRIISDEITDCPTLEIVIDRRN
jgi:hypothetical protein